MPFWALSMAHRREAVEVELRRSRDTEERHRNSNANMIAFKESLFKNGDHFTFRRNDFPYHLEDGIKHFVLWINPEVKLKTRQADFIIDNHLIALGYRNPCQRVFYKNSITIKSIKEIDHIHVFVRDHSRATANNASKIGRKGPGRTLGSDTVAPSRGGICIGIADCVDENVRAELERNDDEGEEQVVLHVLAA